MIDIGKSSNMWTQMDAPHFSWMNINLGGNYSTSLVWFLNNYSTSLVWSGLNRTSNAFWKLQLGCLEMPRVEDEYPKWKRVFRMNIQSEFGKECQAWILDQSELRWLETIQSQKLFCNRWSLQPGKVFNIIGDDRAITRLVIPVIPDSPTDLRVGWNLTRYLPSYRYKKMTIVEVYQVWYAEEGETT